MSEPEVYPRSDLQNDEEPYCVWRCEHHGSGWETSWRETECLERFKERVEADLVMYRQATVNLVKELMEQGFNGYDGVKLPALVWAREVVARVGSPVPGGDAK